VYELVLDGPGKNAMGSGMIASITARLAEAGGQPVLITGAWVQATASQFTTTAAGRITYTGISGVTANITIDATLLAAAGPVNTFTVYLRVNGVMKAQQQITCDATDPQMISVSWRHTFITGEFVEAWIENNDDADDVIVRFATFLVG